MTRLNKIVSSFAWIIWAVLLKHVECGVCVKCWIFSSLLGQLRANTGWVWDGPVCVCVFAEGFMGFSLSCALIRGCSDRAWGFRPYRHTHMNLNHCLSHSHTHTLPSVSDPSPFIIYHSVRTLPHGPESPAPQQSPPSTLIRKNRGLFSSPQTFFLGVISSVFG